MRALLASCVMMVALVLVWVQPVAAQAVGPVYALPGTLSTVFNRSYDTVLTTANGTEYGLVGQTPDIEAQIVQLRSQSISQPDLEVKVWGDRYAAVNESDLEVIVVSSIQESEPVQPTPAATPEATPEATPLPTAQPTPMVPVAVVTAATLNVRSGPGTDYARVGSLTEGQVCAVIGRNQAATWWQLSCAGATSGWVFGELVALAGPVAGVPVVQTAAPPTPAPPTTFVNWRSSFFNNRDLAGAPVLAIDSPNINFDWGTGSPGEAVPNDNFSARFERTMDFSYGTYEISLRMDDGARLYIDDQLIIDDWNIGSPRTRTSHQLLSGSRRLRVEYFEATGEAEIQLSINLVSSSEVWQAAYYAGKGFGTSPLLTRGEPRGRGAPLNYNWGRGAPAPNVPEDNWSARWVGTFNFAGGDYHFVSNVDDGIRVYINGILILDRWLNGAHVNVNNTFRNLGPGNHQIVVEYYESYGDAYVALGWERVGGGDGGGNNNSDNGGRPRDE